MTQSDTTVRQRRKRLGRLAAAAGVPLLAVSLLGSALPANAAPAPRAQLGFDNNAGGFASTFIGDDGALADCIQPGSPNPITNGQFEANARNITVAGNQFGGPVTLTDRQQAAINMVTSTYNVPLTDRSPEANARRAAVAIVVKNLVSQQWEHNVLAAAGYTGNVGDVGDQAHWTTFPAGADVANRARELATQYWSEAQNVQVGSGSANGNPGTVTGSFDVDPNNNYAGSIRLRTTGDTNGTWKVTLHDGKFTSSGQSSATFPANGSATLTQEVVGVPPSPGAKYKIKADFTYTAPGAGGTGGWKPLLNVTRTSDGTQWVASGTGRETGGPREVSGAIEDPSARASVFSPEAVTTSESRYYVGDDKPVDRVRVTLGKNADGTTNQWPRSAQGVYAPIAVKGVLYGPFATKPKQSAAVPAGAPVAGTGTFTAGGSTTDPTGQTFKVTSSKPLPANQEQASGWYTWVTTINGSDQSAAVRPWLDGAARYSYVSAFGIDDESFVSPPKVTTKARTSTGVTVDIDGHATPITGAGLKVEDTITVSGKVSKSDGFYAVNRYYTFPDTIGANGDVIAPANVVCTEQNLSYTSGKVAITGAGDYRTSFRSTDLGVGTWVTTIYSPDGKALTSGSCADKDEWAAVKQLVVTTTASQPADGKATDAAKLWGTVPAGSQIASNLYEWAGKTVSDSDKHLATAGPIGLNEGVVNGVVVTLPTVSFSTSADKVYFVEAVYDLDGKIIAQGKRGVPSETINLTPKGRGGNDAKVGGGSAANLPVVSG